MFRLSLRLCPSGGRSYFSACTHLQRPFSKATTHLKSPLLPPFPRDIHSIQCTYSGSGGVFFNQYRCFFFGSGSDDGDDSNNKKDKDEKADASKEKKDDDESDPADDKDKTDSDDSEPSPSLDNSSKYRKSTRAYSSGGNSNVLLPASRLGFGDQAPRYPHLMALPVTRGPVFPGVLTPITITDQVRQSDRR